MRCLLLAIALIFTPAFAEISDCEMALSPLASLSEGAKAYGSPAKTYSIGANTRADLDLQQAEQLLTPYLHTEMGRARWRYMLNNPFEKGKDIRAQQQLVQYVADHPEQFKDLREHLREIGQLEQNFLRQFENLGTDPMPVEYEVFYAAFTIGSYLAASMVHSFGDLGGLAHRLQIYLLGQAYLSGAANAIKRAQPKRELLEPYRRHMQTVRLAQDPLAQIDNQLARDMREAISVVSLPEKNRRLQDIFYKINAKFSPEDRDLVAVDREVPNGVKSLRTIYRRLLTLNNIWAVYIKKLRIPYDLILKGDVFHISNFQLRNLRALIVANKDEISKLFSAIADLEVALAMADFYNANRNRLNFMEVADLAGRSEQPYIFLKDAHHPLIAIEQPDKSRSNDVVLGRPPNGTGNQFAVVEVSPGSVNLRYLSMIALNTILTQTGLPIFAQQGLITPMHVETFIQPARPEFKESRSSAVARRWSEIEKTARNLPALVLLNEPFTGFGDLQNIAMTVAAIKVLAHSNDIGVLSTTSGVVTRTVREMAGVDLLKADQFQVHKIEKEVNENFDDLGAAQSVLRAGGVSEGFLAETAHELNKMRSNSRLPRFLRYLWR